MDLPLIGLRRELSRIGKAIERRCGKLDLARFMCVRRAVPHDLLINLA